MLLGDLDIASASTLLARFNLIIRRANKSTLAAQTDRWRSEGLDGEDFVDYVCRNGHPVIDTGAENIKILLESSPILPTMFDKIRTAVPCGDKMLAREHVPPLALLWGLAVKLVHTERATMHAALNRLSMRSSSKIPQGQHVCGLSSSSSMWVGTLIFCKFGCPVFLAHSGWNYPEVEQVKGRIVLEACVDSRPSPEI